MSQQTWTVDKIIDYVGLLDGWHMKGRCIRRRSNLPDRHLECPISALLREPVYFVRDVAHNLGISDSVRQVIVASADFDTSTESYSEETRQQMLSAFGLPAEDREHSDGQEGP